MKALKFNIILPLLGLLMFLPSMVMATNGMRLIGYGSVQRSMGGASVAMPLDAATVLSNPAGMIMLDDQVTMGASQFTPKSSLDKVQDLTPASDTVDKESETGGSTMPGVAFQTGSDSVKFGMAAFAAAGMGVDYQGSAIYGAPAYSNYGMFRVSPSIAFDMGALSLGFSYNYGQAFMEFQGGMGAKAEKNQQTGSGYTVGAMLNMGWLTIGFAHETEHDFNPFQFDMDASGDGELDMDMPPTTTYGIGLNFGPLKIAYDISTIRWSETLGENMPESTVPGYSFNLDWKDQQVTKIGMQYEIGKEFQIRAGYNYAEDPTNHDRAFETMMFPAIVEQHNTYGFSWLIDADAKLDVGYMHVQKKTVSGSNPTEQFISYYETSLEENSIDITYSQKF